MGCMTSFGRIILIVLNLVFLLISLALIAVGVILKFFANKILSLIGDVDAVDKGLRDQLHIPNLSDVTELPFVGDIGIALLCFGCLLFLISFCACCGACCQWRPLLIVFVILMAILVLAQAVVGGLFLKKDSALHKEIKKQLTDKMKDYDETQNDVFTFAINMLNYLLKCCGMNGIDDFPGGKPAFSCCMRKHMTPTSIASCKAPTSPYDKFNKEGCYAKLLDEVLAKQTLAIVILALLLLLQVIEIVFAILIVKQVNSVGPV